MAWKVWLNYLTKTENSNPETRKNKNRKVQKNLWIMFITRPTTRVFDIIGCAGTARKEVLGIETNTTTGTETRKETKRNTTLVTVTVTVPVERRGFLSLRKILLSLVGKFGYEAFFRFGLWKPNGKVFLYHSNK